MSDRRLHLNAFGIGYGFHLAAWRHPTVNPHQAWDLDHHIQYARIAERGKLDALFIPDVQGIPWGDNGIEGIGETKPEPITLLSALAAVTEHLGLGATMTTSFHEPYNLARFIGSLDQISRGRAGWNIVTTKDPSDAANFTSTPLADYAERYRRADEFIEVVKGLWSGWDEGAIIGDEQSGQLLDPTKVRRLNHVGEHFSVAGPLSVPRSPQGRPILFQAGSSEVGRDQGARHADVIFTAQVDPRQAADFYADMHRRVAQFGRRRDEVIILPGILPVIGSTQAEADELVASLAEHLDIDTAIGFWKGFSGLDLHGVDLDVPIPDDIWNRTNNAFQSRVEVVRQRAVAESLTARQVLQRSTLGYGHLTAIGTPDKVADTIEQWFVSGAADGFNVLSLLSPWGLERFVDEVVPILQRRKLFRAEYTTTTLREHYGLPPLAA